jgi:hypothetical protein
MLVFPPALRGHITVLDEDGRVCADLTKDIGEPLSVALPTDTYSVHVDNGSGAFETTVTLGLAPLVLEQDALHLVSPQPIVSLPQTEMSFASGLRVERPESTRSFDALVTVGGTTREVYDIPVVGIATTGELSLGATLGNHNGFSYEFNAGMGPGLVVGDNLRVGATIGVGFSGITSGLLGFAWQVPTEGFAILELSRDVRPMAYFRQSYVFGSDARKHGSKMALWGDEAEAGAGLRFHRHRDGFVYGSVREIAGIRYWGLGIGTVL